MKLANIILTFIAGAACSVAGTLNVVQLGPPAEVKLEIKAGAAIQEFTLAHKATTGSFILPDKTAVLRTVGDKIPVQRIKPEESGRIAILHPAGELFAWRLVPSKPTPGKTSLRIINLMDRETSLKVGEKLVKAPPASDARVEGIEKAPFQVELEDDTKVDAPEQEEPGALIGFLFMTGDKWHILLVSDT